MKKLALLAFGATILTGCATPSYNYQPKVQNISKPPIGEVTVANIGDHMLTQGTMSEQEAIYFPANTSITGFNIGSGYYAKRGEDAKYIQYTINDNAQGSGKVSQKPLFDPPAALIVRKEDNSVCMLTVFNTTSFCKPNVNFEKKSWAKADTSSFQQTLIYNGKVGNKINIGYREFSSDLARPAFNNNVEYDLSESKQIGYKGALLEVMDANNQMIKYKVLKNFQ